MTKSEFLTKLQTALENDLDPAAVHENINYYRGYIDDEVRKGRSESDVLKELGDPWVIAQSVIGMYEQNSGAAEYSGYRGMEQGGKEQDYGTRVHTYTVGSWWQKLLVMLAVVAVIVLVVAVIAGIVSLVMPIVLPVLLVILIVNLIKRHS